MSNNDCVKNSVAIAAAACSAILCTQDPGALFYIGLIGSTLLVLTAIISPWLGLLALFPLAFALRPAPPSVGAQEMAFAALLVVVFISALIKSLRAHGFNSTLRLFAMPLLIGVGFFCINLVVAMINDVPLADWIRGVIPFLFIYALIPVCALVGREERNIHWLGASVGTLILLTAGYIVLYYFYTGMWQPYWLISVDGAQVKVSQEAAFHNIQALGPMRDRITMVLAQATDAILPLGMVVGYVVSTLSRDRRVIIASSLLSLLCMSAVLITFTRSMLIGGLFTIALFSLYVFVAHGQLRLKVTASAAIQALFGLTFIFATGMDQIWLGRLNSLSEAALPIATSPIATMRAETTEPIAVTSTREIAEEPSPRANSEHSTLRENSKQAKAHANSKQPKSHTHSKQSTDHATSEQSKPQANSEQSKFPANSEQLTPNVMSSPNDTGANEPAKDKTEDFNVSSRVKEYKIAWETFLSHPVLGKGIGVKHEMRWETSTGTSFVESVGYIHNWPLYVLMVGGVVGFLIYAMIISGPILYKLLSIRSEPAHLTVIRTAAMTLAIYGLFFAVFRLISFNLLLAAAWGVILAQKGIMENNREVKDTAPPDASLSAAPEANTRQGTAVKNTMEISEECVA